MTDNQAPEMLKPADFMKKQSSPSVHSLQSVASNSFFKGANQLPQSTPLSSEVDPDGDQEDTDFDLESCSSIVDFNSTHEDLQANATSICDIFKNIALNDLLQEDEDDCKFSPSNDETDEGIASSSSGGNSSGSVKVLSSSMDMKDYIALLPVDDPVHLLGFDVITDPTIQLPFQDLREGEIKIYISEIFSPIHFWFHQGYNVDKIMIQLKNDYIGLADRELILSEKNFQPGLLVACYLELYLNWNRAMVINPIDPKGYVRLLFIDYGTVGKVHSRNVKYLFTKYLKMPRMALRGRLHNLKPPNSQGAWSEQEIVDILVRVGNDELKATVLKTDEELQVHELDITSEGQNLRDWMIQKSIATSFELKTANSNYPMCYFFPTFAMLEQGNV